MDKKLKITHVMKDGTERDSIEGLVVPLNEKTELFYNTISSIVKRNEKEESIS